LQPEQATKVSLLFGSSVISPFSVTTPVNTAQPTTLIFKIPSVQAGQYLVRLRVEGIDSLPITISGSPPVMDFDPQQRITVA
jgi:hypothetical protein